MQLIHLASLVYTVQIQILKSVFFSLLRPSIFHHVVLLRHFDRGCEHSLRYFQEQKNHSRKTFLMKTNENYSTSLSSIQMKFFEL